MNPQFNAVTEKPYNEDISFELRCQGFDDPRWLTEAQANRGGGRAQRVPRTCFDTPRSARLSPIKKLSGIKVGEFSTRVQSGLRTLELFNVQQTYGCVEEYVKDRESAGKILQIGGTLDPLTEKLKDRLFEKYLKAKLL